MYYIYILNVLLNLFSVPPEKLLITDESGAHIPHYTIGPYNEGSSVNVTCVSTGGKWFEKKEKNSQSIIPYRKHRHKHTYGCICFLKFLFFFAFNF